MTDVQLEDAVRAVVRARELALTGQGRQLRRLAGLSLEVVADRAGMDVGSLSRYERGAQFPRYRHALGWVSTLNTIIEALQARGTSPILGHEELVEV